MRYTKIAIISLIFIFTSHVFAQQKRFSLGIMVSDVDINYAKFIGMENNDGVYIKGVLKDSPADKAGLKIGDVITEINRTKIRNALEFTVFLNKINPESELVLHVIRGKDVSVDVKLKSVEVTKILQAGVAQKAQSFDFDRSIVEVDEINFDKEVRDSKAPVLAYFYAKWCPPCKKFAPIVNELVKQYGSFLKIVAIDVQKSENLAKKYGIGGLLPSLILFSNGNEFDKIILLSSKEQIDNLLSKYKSFTEEKVEIVPELGKESRVESVAFIDDSNFFVSKRQNKVSIWDFEKGTLEKVYYSPVISSRGKYLAFVEVERNSFKWGDVLNDRFERVNGDQFIEEIAISSNGRYVATFGKDTNSVYSIKIWDLKNKVVVKNILTKVNSFSIQKQCLFDFSSDGLLFVLSVYGRTTVYDTKDWNELFTFVHTDESFRSINFSPDGRYILAVGKNSHLLDLKEKKEIKTNFLTIWFSRNPTQVFEPKKGNYFELVDFNTNKTLVVFPNYLAPITSAAASSDSKFVLSGSSDGSVKLWDYKTGAEIAQFIDYGDNEWVVITKEGYYASSINGHRHVKVRKGKSVYSIEQFYDVFYRPDIVMAKLRGEDISSLITLTIDEVIKNPPPVVEITSLPKETTQPKVKVCYQVKSTGGGIGEVRLFHNGKLVHSDGFYKDIATARSYKHLAALSGKKIYEEMRGIKIAAKGEIGPIQSKSKGDIFEDCQEIDASYGENEVSVAAFNRQNTVQSFIKTASFNAKIQPQEPKLYILSIGIDKYKDPAINLKYAVKDARDMLDKIVKQSSTIYKSENIYYEIFTDNNATKENILNRILKISQSSKPYDSFILFVAGHGVLLENQYYVLTHDFDGNINPENLISSNEIVEISKKIKSLSQLFIFDTCHAGGVDYIISGLYDARMSVLAKKLGLHIYASASSIQEALDGYRGNGLFTYTLLDGLNNNKIVDKNNDGKVSLKELGKYSQLKTVEISRSIGHMQTPLIINFGRDNVVYELKR